MSPRSLQRLVSSLSRLTVHESHSRHVSSGVRNKSTLKSSNLHVTLCSQSQRKEKPSVENLSFGKHYTDHLFRVRWTEEGGWEKPKILPFHRFSLHPGAKVLHYAQEIYEGMKAYLGVDGQIRLFRPNLNMDRMNISAERACLPTFDGQEFLECIKRLVQIDMDWVPHCSSSSLYIRPTMIATDPTLGLGPGNEAELFVILSPVGPYFSTGVKPVNLLADPHYVRAWPGGCGFAKMGSNYAPTMWTQKVAEKFGCHQCLWLFGDEQELTEVGAMNVFVFLETENGERELVTPPAPIGGMVLPGVTRRSILELAKEWQEFNVTERKITMNEVMKAKSEGRLIEMFGSGTAAIVSQIGGIYFHDQMHHIPVPSQSLATRFLSSITDIFYGRVNHPWAVTIKSSEDPQVSTWSVDQLQTTYKPVEANQLQ